MSKQHKKNKTLLTVIFLYFLYISISATQAYSKSNEENDEVKKIPIRITSEKMETYSKRNMVAFIDNVHVNKDDMSISSNRLEVYRDKTQKKEIQSFIAIGSVTILKGDIIATCDKAIYLEKEQIITLIGNSKLKKEDNVIESGKIIFYIQEEEIKAFSDKKNRVEVILYPEEIEKPKSKNSE